MEPFGPPPGQPSAQFLANSTPLDRAIALRRSRAADTDQGISRRSRLASPRHLRSLMPLAVTEPAETEEASETSRTRARLARDILDQLPYIVPSRLDSPDRHLFFERSLLALEGSLLGSFNASHWRLDAGGWTALDAQTNTALDRANAMVGLFEEAHRLRGGESIRRAQKLFSTGRRYLCSALIYCFPVALRKFLELNRTLCRIGAIDFARVVMWHIANWAYRSTQAPRELWALFAAMYRIEDQDQISFLVQAHNVAHRNLRLLSGSSLNPSVHYWHLRAMKLELEQEPGRLIESLEIELTNIRASPEHTLRLELNCILEVARAYQANGELEQAAEIAKSANQRICDEKRLGDLYWQFAAYAEVVGPVYWDIIDHKEDAIKYMERCISALEEAGVSGGPVRTLVQMCQDCDEKLRNEYAELAYRQQRDVIISSLETDASTLEADVGRIEMEESDLQENATQVSQRDESNAAEDGTVESRSKSPEDELAWRENVSLEERQSLRLPTFQPEAEEGDPNAAEKA